MRTWKECAGSSCLDSCFPSCSPSPVVSRTLADALLLTGRNFCWKIFLYSTRLSAGYRISDAPVSKSSFELLVIKRNRPLSHVTCHRSQGCDMVNTTLQLPPPSTTTKSAKSASTRPHLTAETESGRRRRPRLWPLGSGTTQMEPDGLGVIKRPSGPIRRQGWAPLHHRIVNAPRPAQERHVGSPGVQGGGGAKSRQSLLWRHADSRRPVGLGAGCCPLIRNVVGGAMLLSYLNPHPVH
jgi:hypothetical protein